jgi:hypothetical protein
MHGIEVEMDKKCYTDKVWICTIKSCKMRERNKSSKKDYFIKSVKENLEYDDCRSREKIWFNRGYLALL